MLGLGSLTMDGHGGNKFGLAEGRLKRFSGPGLFKASLTRRSIEDHGFCASSNQFVWLKFTHPTGSS